MKRRIIYALIVLGFTSMAGQIILMRELLTVFYGNELSFGITLASWLFWVGFGSLCIARPLAGKIKNKVAIFALCEVCLAFILPLTIFAERFLPSIFGYLPGEIIGILPMIFGSFILLAPLCILGGFLFTLGCEIFDAVREAEKIGYVYIFEAMGAAAGGMLTSLILIRFLPPLYIMFIIAVLNLLAAYVLLSDSGIPAFLTGTTLLAFLLFLSAGGAAFLNRYSLNRQWKAYGLISSENSVYGNTVITKREDQYSVFTNGLYAFSVPDKLASEMSMHFPLLEHRDPKSVLLIGGGPGGGIGEVLKHPVERVDYVELDPLIIDLAARFLPENEAFQDMRVNVITDIDGRLYVKRTGQKYDVIIINLPGPYTAQLNRFYTKEFYLEADKILREDGILSFSSYSNPNSLSEEQIKLYATLKGTMEKVFQDVVITPGTVNYFLASKKKGLLSLDWRVLMDVLRKRRIETQYMREYYLSSELSEERIEDFKKRLMLADKEAAQTGRHFIINTDFQPIAYYYDMVLWTAQFKYSLKKFFKAVEPKKIYAGAAIAYLTLLAPLLIKRRLKRFPNWGILTCVGTAGFAEMAYQVITLVAFQVMYGYVYYKLGIILTSYMIGLIFGSWLMTKKMSGITSDYSVFVKTQILIFIYPLILALFFWIFSNLRGKCSFWMGSNIVFPFLPAIAGLIGGLQFPLANKLYLKTSESGTGRSAGLTYGIDIFGACLGAVFVSVFFIPIVGIYASCILVAALNLTGLILLLPAHQSTNHSLRSGSGRCGVSLNETPKKKRPPL